MQIVNLCHCVHLSVTCTVFVYLSHCDIYIVFFSRTSIMFVTCPIDCECDICEMMSKFYPNCVEMLSKFCPNGCE
jgi:hypothetical protein